ncbi:hypothetical protein M422DRAFT_226899 [Sphaerobolus stellatus SS14]|uniref:PPM-type phosphatase domain-containing protein n=1 Tax=Sphaerobolus stellatus (strain SS14) TaxID=990650 RepID=A0A0C9USK9_SPHS4|nr:hypothetical protein M422DRAFT_226899 [Sphaerobolus stellatus SS14]
MTSPITPESATGDAVYKWTDFGASKQGFTYGPFKYQVIPQEEITAKLKLLANVTEHPETNITSVNLQPCLFEGAQSQDRKAIYAWPLKNGVWKFIAVLDGHGGHDTVDFTAEDLPRRVKGKLEELLLTEEVQTYPEAVLSALEQAILEVDNQLITDLLNLFPGGLDGLHTLSQEEIDKIINDGGERLKKVHRCMRGTTVLVALIDPTGENLWIANLGDCEALLGTPSQSNVWKTFRITKNHGGNDPEEVQRIQAEHPGEEECILNNRVLGAIAVTRAIGDVTFKLHNIVTQKVFLAARPGFTINSKIEAWLPRNITPPYLSNKADVTHHKIQKDLVSKTASFLLMYSDGLIDPRVNEGEPAREQWVNVAGNAIREGKNPAFEVLKDVLGGEDNERVSQYLTVECTDKWMDDITVAVVQL